MDGRIIDLTVPVGAATKSPPSTDMCVQLERHRRGPGFWQVTSVQQSLHTGTHVDSGLHCYEDGGTTDKITLDQSAAKRSSSTSASSRPRPRSCATPTPASARARSRWCARRGRTGHGATSPASSWSPFLAVEAAEFLVSLQPKAVCFDFFEEYSARLPEFSSEDFRVHKAFLGKGIVIIEQATCLGQRVGRRFDFFAPFSKLVDVEGAPARIFAVVHD